MASPPSQTLVEGWLQELEQDHYESPNNRNYWAGDARSLITSSQPISFNLGTGNEVWSSMLSKCEAAQQELIIVTCFWAQSSSQEAIASLLRKLSAKALTQNRKIQVRICFSSIGIIQKLFQTSSPDGKFYPPPSWASIGLPPPEDLTGLVLVVKSVFQRPFSVMHPKFVLVDRHRAFMPSCNVSWEQWFEGCIEMKGDITNQLFNFWLAFWSRGGPQLPSLLRFEPEALLEPSQELTPSIKQIIFQNTSPSRTTILLPSPHNLNPNFRFIFSTPQPPPTPLNTFILHALSQAKTSIYIQTPNLTCFPVISALLDALSRGVNIKIIVSSQLMILEQLVTAGTITEFEVWKLRRRHNNLRRSYQQTLSRSDPENLMEQPGQLKIGYYHPRENSSDSEPVKSHIKCTIIDQEVVVLGSGNMDRASWYTSQELGVAFISSQFARDVMGAIEESLDGRVGYIR